jgi:hypothetical protein
VKGECLPPRRNGDLDIAGALDVKPGTFGDSCSALAATMRFSPPECKRRLAWQGRPQVSVEDRRRPLRSVCDHEPDPSATMSPIRV